MAYVSINDEYLTAIGNTIRDKNGSTATYRPKDMPRAIQNIAIQDEPSVADAILSKTIANYSNSRITKIKTNGFYKCANLATVSAPNVLDVGDNAFYGCSNLASVNLPNATIIGSHAFRDCINLTTITLPKFNYCETEAFYNCENLTTVDLGEETTSIGNYAFYFCDNLTTVILRANSVVNIDSNYNPFYGSGIISNDNAHIYVPAALLDAYKASTSGWPASLRIGDTILSIESLEG